MGEAAVIGRKEFLIAVRNRIAAGVLCSGLLTDFLERQVIEEEPAYTYTTYSLGFNISQEMIEDDFYGPALRSLEGKEAQWLRGSI